MKASQKISIILVTILITLTTTVQAHGGNITGWKDKNSEKIIKSNEKYFGYHNENGKRHYHEVEWNEEKQKWEIVMSAVYYDEKLTKINNSADEKTEKVQVEFLEKVDGDTAKFGLNGENITVRFLGIDTPETVHPTKGEEPFGKEASDFSQENLQNAQKIELEYDKNADKTDKYERHLAWIWVDDVLLQAELVKNGLAKTYMLQDNYKYAGLLQENEEMAKGQKIKIWSDESNENGSEKQEIGEVEEYSITEIVGMIVIFAVGIVIKFLKKKR